MHYTRRISLPAAFTCLCARLSAQRKLRKYAWIALLLAGNRFLGHVVCQCVIVQKSHRTLGNFYLLKAKLKWITILIMKYNIEGIMGLRTFCIPKQRCLQFASDYSIMEMLSKIWAVKKASFLSLSCTVGLFYKFCGLLIFENIILTFGFGGFGLFPKM